ncbi:hypothetical protein L195_g008336 [Trifolium pratense]|uniref:Uncharacterized protein n=1 Tax=Trifolium pratense TaxID=57577 RepID=A0A2K3P8W5_TRIPR|nr:hypothetical protein L195_g008336 [Trifolium pratense]
MLHCLKGCSYASKLWHSLSFTDINFYSVVDVVAWIKSNGIGPIVSLFLVRLWWNWKARNAMCVGNEPLHDTPRLEANPFMVVY